ncbi:MAG TPA: GNAT family protein [Armatimonadota bacterium]|jgi:RimJ/RimL family protein N-acetyltransferase
MVLDPAVLIYLEGEKVALGPLRRDLLPLYTRWINDLHNLRGLGMRPQPITAEQEQDWFESASRNTSSAHFTIFEAQGRRPVGNTGLSEIDHRNGTATFGILIGERDCWGQGYGTEATRLMLDYGFTALGLHNIDLRVFSYNQRAVRAYLRAGFQETGRRREAIRLAGVPYDVIYMDCLSTEFKSEVVAPILDQR